MARIARRVAVTGRVTGVGFRYAALRAAAELPGLTGFVRNADWDTVECVIQGESEQVEAMTAWLRRGPLGAEVSGCQVSSIPVLEGREPFHIAD